MGISPKEFKERITAGLVEVIWRHWVALGVSAHGSVERTVFVDIEPLIITTFLMGRSDLRLLEAAYGWMNVNAAVINRSRLKAVLKLFQLRLDGSPDVLYLDVASHFVHQKTKTAKHAAKTLEGFKGMVDEDYRSSLSHAMDDPDLVSPDTSNPALLQLRLRLIFGVDARVETLSYLAFHANGNSNAIARETCYWQKNIYLILERWALAGIVNKSPAGYSLSHGPQLLKSLGVTRLPTYINWPKAYAALVSLAHLLHREDTSRTEYLGASRFRDLQNEVGSAAGTLGLTVPSPTGYPGAAYFAPFAEAVLAMLDRLNNPPLAGR